MISSTYRSSFVPDGTFPQSLGRAHHEMQCFFSTPRGVLTITSFGGTRGEEGGERLNSSATARAAKSQCPEHWPCPAESVTLTGYPLDRLWWYLKNTVSR